MNPSSPRTDDSLGDDYDWFNYPDEPKVEMPERRVWHLLDKDGKVLRTFSDKPPVGFHQGERGK